MWDVETLDETPRVQYKKKGDSITRPFISCDLETYRGDDGKAKIMLFGFSTGERVSGADLAVKDLLALMDRVGEKYKPLNPIYIGFGFRYEVSFYCRDMPWRLADRLWKGKGRNSAIHWRGYRWEYLKAKYFQVSKPKVWSIRIYECLSWFNSSLAIAATKHLSDTELWQSHGEFIKESKDRRSDFTLKDLSTVTEYWEKEQAVFVALMDRIRDLIVSADLPIPRNWWGPSALTSACFRHFGVAEHMPAELPDDFLMACRFAYYGGRFEQFKAGYYDGPVKQYDITSAYPHTMRSLWSWKDSRLRYIENGKSEPLHKFALYHIRYRSMANPWRAAHIPHPFPFRDPRGQIFFPPYVEGWYWSPEVSNLWDSKEIQVLDAWIIEPGTEKPFQWVEELFELRCEYKRDGNPAEYVVKITINSAYGKTAQRVGWNEEKLTPPEFHQLAWAGFITSNCRAMVWQATVLAKGGVFQIETDAVFTTREISLPLVSGKSLAGDLGLWERADYEGMLNLQNGIYWVKQNGNWKKPKFRGMRKNARGIGLPDAMGFLQRLSLSGREAEPLKSETIAFYGHGYRGTHKHMRWLSEPKITKFAGEGKRYWLGRGNPSAGQIQLTNGITRRMEEYGYGGIVGHTYPHHLPWDLSDIAKEIKDAEELEPIYG